MNYVLTPTQNDILHYSKGSESKTHKYISRVFKKGRWVYTYAKNKLRGNAVTNKNGSKGFDGSHTVTQYNPNVKTINPYQTNRQIKVGIPNGPRQLSYSDSTGDHYINPTVTKAITKGMVEVMSPSNKSAGLEVYGKIMNSHQELGSIPVTNRSEHGANWDRITSQYSPTYKTTPSVTNANGTAYSPTYKTDTNYSPTVKTEKSVTRYENPKTGTHIDVPTTTVREPEDWRKSATGKTSYNRKKLKVKHF